nr:uncharacterized protein LOC111422751 [Onthophagus taurus]
MIDIQNERCTSENDWLFGEIGFESLDITVNVITLTEHWLKADEVILVDSYKVASTFSRVNNQHGGSCILVRNDLKYTELMNIKDKSKEFVIECSAIKLNVQKVTIICIYRSPKSDIEDFFNILEDILLECSPQTLKTKLLLTGDLNINLENRNTNTLRLLDMLNRHNLRPTINKPTRITEYSSSLIDNIYVNIESCNSEVIISTLSDHTAQKISFPITTIDGNTQVKMLKKRIFSNTILSEIHAEIHIIDWNFLSSYKETDELYDKFIDVIHNCIIKKSEKNLIKMNVKSATNKWLTKEIKNKTRVKRQLYEGMLMGKIDKEYYNIYSRHVRNEIAISKRTVFTNFIETAKNKVRATWNTINTLRQNKQSEDLDLCDFQHIILLNL